MALQMAKLSAIKTLTGFDFAFQPSLDKNRVMALAGLQFIDRAEAVHLIGPLGTGKTHLSLALGVEAVKACRSVYFSSLADIVASLARAEREGALRERIRYFCRFALLIVDEIGYLPVIPGGGNLFFQLVNARYERGAMILTASPSGETSSATSSSPPRSSNASCIMPSCCKSRVELSLARARRPLARTHQDQSQHPDLAYSVHTKTSRKAAQQWRRAPEAYPFDLGTAICCV